jgi:hypothetical protein
MFGAAKAKKPQPATRNSTPDLDRAGSLSRLGLFRPVSNPERAGRRGPVLAAAIYPRVWQYGPTVLDSHDGTGFLRPTGSAPVALFDNDNFLYHCLPGHLEGIFPPSRIAFKSRPRPHKLARPLPDMVRPTTNMPARRSGSASHRGACVPRMRAKILPRMKPGRTSGAAFGACARPRIMI